MTFIKGRTAWNKGIKMPEIAGKNSYNWKEKDYGYSAIHMWVYSKLGKAAIYTCATKDKTCKGRMEWANISRKYLRNLLDWKILCTSHHVRFDMTDEARKNMSESHKGQIPWNKGLKLGPNPEHSKRMKGNIPWNKGLKFKKT